MRKLWWFYIPVWLLIASGLALSAYVRFVEIPAIRAETLALQQRPIPCTEGMTLMPGQSCFVQIIIPVRHPKQARDDL